MITPGRDAANTANQVGVPNAFVYILRSNNVSDLPAIGSGIPNGGESCDRCDEQNLGSVLTGAVTDATGAFMLEGNIPVGTHAHTTYRGRLVSPGFAAQSLHIETKLNKRSGSAVALLGVSREAFYALQFIELGTSKYPAHPWLLPAFASSEDAMLQGLASEMRKRVERIAKKRAAGRR